MEKSPGWEALASKYHRKLKEVMAPHKKNVMQTAQIKKIIEHVPELKGEAQWIFPSDHCVNHTNKGACFCAETDDAIFKQIARGKYRVL